jgi:hypothetical protein
MPIFELRQYADESGAIIQERSAMETRRSEFFSGSSFRVSRGAEQLEVPFEFKIEADTVEQAFANLPAIRRSAMVEAKRQYERRLLECQRQLSVPLSPIPR